MKFSYETFPDKSQEIDDEEDIEDDLVVHNDVRRGNFMSNLSDQQLLKIAQMLSDNSEAVNVDEEEVSPSQEDQEDNFIYSLEQGIKELNSKFSTLYENIDNVKGFIEKGNVSNFSPNSQVRILTLVEVLERSHEDLGSLINSIVV